MRVVGCIQYALFFFFFFCLLRLDEVAYFEWWCRLGTHKLELIILAQPDFWAGLEQNVLARNRARPDLFCFGRALCKSKLTFLVYFLLGPILVWNSGFWTQNFDLTWSMSKFLSAIRPDPNPAGFVDDHLCHKPSPFPFNVSQMWELSCFIFPKLWAQKWHQHLSEVGDPSHT